MTKSRTPSPSEAVIQRAILKYLNAQPHCWATKFPGVLRRGVPDVLGVYRGMFFALEVKRPGGRVTPLQQAALKSIQSAAGRAEVVHSIDEVRQILLEIDEELALQRFGQ